MKSSRVPFEMKATERRVLSKGDVYEAVLNFRVRVQNHQFDRLSDSY